MVKGTGASRKPTVVPGPLADCSVDAAGRMTVTFALPGARAPGLLLRKRPPKKGREKAGEQAVHVPLVREDASPDRWQAVVLPDEHRLAEGRWDVYAVDGPDGPQGARHRLTPGVRDLRVLLSRTAPPAAGAHIAVRVPYKTKDGYLAVRAWLRTAHAEAGAIDLGGDAVTVRARLLGARLESGATALVRRRGPRGFVYETGVRDEGAGRLSFTLGLRDLVRAREEDHEFWDVFVVPGRGAPRVRVGRFLDDVADKKYVFTYPATDAAGARVTPYYTVDNDLSLDVTA